MKTREAKWLENFIALLDYVREEGHLPQKNVVEDRALLNWWKYNKKCRKLGSLTAEQEEKLDGLKSLLTGPSAPRRRR